MTVQILDPFGISRDAAMPFLARAIDAAEVAPQLAAALEPTAARLLAIRVVRYKPSWRCLIEYDLELTPPGGFPEPAAHVGPGRVGEALGITHAMNGHRLDRKPFEVLAPAREVQVVAGPRIGISKAMDVPWRFGEAGSRFVSRAFR